MHGMSRTLAHAAKTPDAEASTKRDAASKAWRHIQETYDRLSKHHAANVMHTVLVIHDSSPGTCSLHLSLNIKVWSFLTSAFTTSSPSAPSAAGQ